ncbi:glycosyltransferase family 2 protein [Pantoea sp. NPDC088449]|uniref:glycosyltransferase family 2 protein n=1 Tax=Pantoea sp. NPDC088449 TaxID=3364392 RepID=UPI00382303B6
MSLIKGNKYSKEGNYDLAFSEYKKIALDSPLYPQAKFNIERMANLGLITEISPIKPFEKHSNKPLLSIIMPVFNVGPYLDASIQSVLSQSLRDFELIIVNDASTDNGKKIIEMYKNIDDRVKIINLSFNTLGGAGIPSNIGIKASQGKYIGFVDSDDWIVNDAFESLINTAEKFNAEIVIGDFRTFHEDNRAVSDSYDKKRWENIPLNKVTQGSICSDLFTMSPVPWRKLYLTSFMKEKNILFPEGDYFYEDNPLHWFVLSEAERVVVIDKLISYHRMAREGQTMGSSSYKLAAISSHLNTTVNFLSQNKIKKQSVLDAFYDYCYRTSWIIDKQLDQMTKNLIKHRLFDIYCKAQSISPPVNIRPNFKRKFEDYSKSYPKLDLTIVMPVYNCEDLIAESIESVLKISNLKYNLLIIDDGSSDRTAEICQNYANNHKNINFYMQVNKGAGRARNSIIPLCTGKYTFFLDADDVINANGLENSVKKAITDDADLLFMKYRIEFFEEKKSRGMFNGDLQLWDSLSKDDNATSIKKNVAALINYPWNRIIKTNFLHDKNIFFGSTVVHNDVLYHWHSIIAAKKISYIDQEVCTHRKFSQRDQITNISDSRRLMVFEALRYTQEQITKQPDFHKIKSQWETFSTELIQWAEKRIPNEHKDSFFNFKNEFVKNLPKFS